MRKRPGPLTRFFIRFDMAVCGLVLPFTLWQAVTVDWTVIFGSLILAAGFAVCFTANRAICRAPEARPDYARIARLEREIFGEAFRHDGAPDDGEPQMGGFCLPAGPEFVIPRPASAEGYAYNCFKCQSTWRSDQFLGFCPDCDRKPGVTFEEFSRGMELLGEAIRNGLSSGDDSPAS